MAEVDLLVTVPAEVLGAQVAVVRLARFSIYSVGGVALRASNASALGQGRPACWTDALYFIILVITVETYDAELAAARKAMSHPLELIDELELTDARATDRFFVEFLDAFDLGLVLSFLQVQ